MDATKEQINEATSILRELIDDAWETRADLFGENAANRDYKPHYDAATLLHEHAMKGANDA